ncbi:MAG TPA: lytic transglycosylase domain-containing protein [Anaeromyxobacteraceae bacterium]|nr:lytic transglycosylase domain-containing protein [Anaeromyxobacteraceae bacterium]
MRRPLVRGCLAAGLAIVVMAVVMAVPRAMGDLSALPRIETFISVACGGSSPCPSVERVKWLEELESVLAERVRGLSKKDRTRLADVIYEEAKAASLDPLFVIAFIEVESRFDLVAESEAGARGLMQLRPETLKLEAERSDLDGDDLDDPVVNVRAGVRYFSQLLSDFGSTDLALMAYNAGPNRISRYLQEDGSVPDRFLVFPKRIHSEQVRLKRRHTPSPKLALSRLRRALGAGTPGAGAFAGSER